MIRTLTLPCVAQEFAAYAQVSIVDESIRTIPSRRFNLVGITCDTNNSPRAYELAQRFRREGMKVIMGGTHPTIQPEEALEYCDSVVIGEVEGLGASIFHDLEIGRLKPRYKALQPPELSPYPADFIDQLPDYGQFFKPFPIELTRGCRHDCLFCFNRYIHGGGFRRRHLDDLVTAIAGRKERRLVCMDDNIMNDPRLLAAFAEKVTPLRKIWGGQSTVDLADDPDLLKILKRSGFSFTFIGLESISVESLRSVRKGFNRVPMYADRFARLRDHGIMPFAGIIVGLDGDGPEVFDRTFEALVKIAPAACAFTMPVAFPGTAYYRQLSAEGRILNDDPAVYDGHHVVIKPAGMSVNQLEAGYHRLAESFFGWKASITRLLKYSLWKMNLTPADTLISYLTITMGYRIFHQRLAGQGSAPHRMQRFREADHTVESFDSNGETS